MIETLTYLHTLPLQLPPVTPVEPPGMGGIKTIINWVAWGVMIACIVGFIIGIGVLVLGEHSPETRGGKKIIVALIGMALLGAVAGIFGAVTGG